MFQTNSYLWSIKIEELPFGAEQAVIEAIHDYPKGKTILLPPNDWDGETDEEFFFDPIGFKNKLIETFYVTADEARSVFESDHLVFQKKVNVLLQLDARLYMILYHYLNEIHDASTLDSSDIINQLKDTQLYFTQQTHSSGHIEWLNQLNQLKFLQLN